LGGQALRDKRKKFVELAEKRVTRAIHDIQLIGNLSNRSNYEYTDTDIRKILRALDDEVKSLRSRFGKGNGAAEPMFKLT
jgi:hypothetical protein